MSSTAPSATPAPLRSAGRVLVVLAAMMTGLTAGGALAQSPASEQFERGKAAFNAGDYESALAAFSAAADAGMQGVALDYNLGVTYYRLGRYRQARTAFLRVTSHEAMAPVGHYNLGLVALRLEEPEEARRRFERARSQASDPRLAALAARQLERLRPPEQRGWASAGAGAGYDSNVRNPELDISTGQSDSFYELSALGAYRVAGSARSGVTLDGTLWRTDYRDVDALDMDLASGGIEAFMPIGGWRSSLRGGYEVTRLGSDPFLNTASLRLQSERVTASGRYRLRYAYDDIDADEDFAFLSGYRQRLEARARFPWRDHWWGLEYRFESNDRQDLSTPTAFISYSPRRHELRLYADARLPERWRLESELGYRDSRYADEDFSAGSGAIRREDDRAQVLLRIGRPLTRRLELTAEMLYTENDSNIDGFSYTQTLALVNLFALF